MATKRTSRSPKERKEPHWLVVLLVGALLTVVLGALITTHTLQNGWDDAKGLVQSKPSAHDQTINKFYGQVEDAELWAHKPTIFPASETLIKRHYKALNPLELHDFVAAPVLSTLELLIERAAVQPGKFLITYGRVLTSSVIEPTTGNYRSTMVQLVAPSAHVPPTSNEADPVVYCRVPLPEVPVLPKQHVFAEGVVVASGIALSSNGGVRQAVYMDCAAIAPPYGHCGHLLLPPLPEPFWHCGPFVLQRYQQKAARENLYPHEANESAYIEPL
jgi:hypothetical protein